MKGKTLVSFSASLQFLQAFSQYDLPNGHEGLLSHIETEIAKDHSILGATQVAFDYEIQKGGENIKTKEEYILLIIEGMFTTGKRTPDHKRIFDSKPEVKIVARKIGSVTETDSDAIWASALGSYLQKVNALKYPYRG